MLRRWRFFGKRVSSSRAHRGPLVKNPAVQIARDSLDQMDKWGAKLGLSPADRQRLSIEPNRPDPFNDLDALADGPVRAPERA
ncbi:P27 family phage terminase small subunit [Yinghuangia aomiensis]